MPCWATSKGRRKTLEAVVQRRAQREPLLLLVLALGNTVEGLEGQAICCKAFFIEINPDISLGMDSNCILVALFGLFFCVICTHNHYVHGEFQFPTSNVFVYDTIFGLKARVLLNAFFGH